MSRRTKKIGIAGKYGARYGVKIRKQVATIEKLQKQKHTCPRCSYKTVKRVSTGIWHCRHCDLTFASGAYIPREVMLEELKKEEGTEEEAEKKVDE